MTKLGVGLGEGYKAEEKTAPSLIAPFFFGGPAIANIFMSIFFGQVGFANFDFQTLVNFYFKSLFLAYIFGFAPIVFTVIFISFFIKKYGKISIILSSLMGGIFSLIINSIIIFPNIILNERCDPFYICKNEIAILPVIFLAGFLSTAVLMYITRDRQNKIAIAYGFEPPHKTI